MTIPKSVSKYMEEIGRRGGRKSSPAKIEAARLNATRPRPNGRKPRGKKKKIAKTS